MAAYEDNNPFAGADELATDQLQSTDHFATILESEDQEGDSLGRRATGFPSFRDSYETSSHITDDPNAERPAIREGFSSRIEQLLIGNPDLEILIVDAGKSHEGSGGGYIAYTIRTGDLSVRRRYSEFESLRNGLVRLFPTLIVPPIPEKHTMADYAAKPTKAKEDSRIIDHRRRMLAVFLNRCRAMRQIREHAVFQKFLDPNVSWIEVLNSPPLISIPKSILRAPPLDTGNPTPEHAYLPVPSPSARLRDGDNMEFQAAEINAKEYEIIMSSGIERVNKRILKRYGEIAVDLAELGARYNAWSLNEVNTLAAAIENVGQAVDLTYISTEELISSLLSSFSEPLGESAQFAGVVRAVLKYRHQKALQYEITKNSLAVKRDLLGGLERTEMESQRINEYLLRRDDHILRADGQQIQRDSLEGVDQDEFAKAELAMDEDANVVNKQGKNGPEESTNGSTHHDESVASADVPTVAPARRSFEDESFPPTHAHMEQPYATVPRVKKSNGFRIPVIGKISDAFHGMVDVDPETTRRNNIGKTREEIQIFEASLRTAESDLEQASASIKADLARYEKTKEHDLRRMMIAYAKCHIEWARKNLESWERAKARVEEIKVK
ncbi:hypothetical protein V1525DRAFT_404981 [Lipomyces kononenkoae]|uniref:Uncharacterized protein n=1 Tax=Lipomyces kononenkoae TaxID=34357 RepID=A0ACC3T0G2_LIPKO